LGEVVKNPHRKKLLNIKKRIGLELIFLTIFLGMALFPVVGSLAG
jgi:hypothetical protein